MALDPCVKQILCALGAAVLGALNAVIQTQKALLTAQVVALQAQLLALDVATIPLEAARSIANEVLNQARTAATLVPFELIAGCVDLGEFNFSLTESIDSALREVNDLVDDLNRLLSFKEELQLLVDEFNRIIEQFDQILLAIQECGGSS